MRVLVSRPILAALSRFQGLLAFTPMQRVWAVISGGAEYPDSEKAWVWAGDAHYMLRRPAHLDYWDGER